jgi:hypothetical protein
MGSALIFGGSGELDSAGSGQGPVAGLGECGDEPGFCATELVNATSTRRKDHVSLQWRECVISVLVLILVVLHLCVS